jgi:adenylosuccinate synthase
MTDVFVGMQYGSEGKGKIVASVAHEYDGAVRTGAPNAGHTIIVKDETYKMRSVPCAWVNPRCQLFIGPGGLVNVDILAKELASLPEHVMSRLKIDVAAGIIVEADIKEEEETQMNAKNGSTAEGVGVAQARKVLRKNGIIASMIPALAGYMSDVSGELNAMMDEGLRIMLEGTQGFGLSMNHGPYPFTTSRDVIASSLLSDAGIAPSQCGAVFGVMRTYPIRVAGNSGPMGAKELEWATVEARCGAPAGSIIEKTTVTNRVRRVSEMDWGLIKRATALNRPDAMFITFGDYIDWEFHNNPGAKRVSAVRALYSFIEEVERKTGVPVAAVSVGPMAKHTIWFEEVASKFFNMDRLAELNPQIQ